MLYLIQRKVIIYKAYKVKAPYPYATNNGIRVKYVDTIIHLAHLLIANGYGMIVMCPNISLH